MQRGRRRRTTDLRSYRARYPPSALPQLFACHIPSSQRYRTLTLHIACICLLRLIPSFHRHTRYTRRSSDIYSLSLCGYNCLVVRRTSSKRTTLTTLVRVLST
ncbi:hypothetical protein ARMGADRAFT_567960 [Armillaria gallica]|uniref:Uncharacterized protein n=1 Tax=Armillaria gallica TaxID=47427 RepID=A0A2H3E4M2_ARMGA|nr:hypothetical protein ARMGADRAFT_567960 [Armillaria gallica]